MRADATGLAEGQRVPHIPPDSRTMKVILSPTDPQNAKAGESFWKVESRKSGSQGICKDWHGVTKLFVEVDIEVDFLSYRACGDSACAVYGAEQVTSTLETHFLFFCKVVIIMALSPG